MKFHSSALAAAAMVASAVGLSAPAQAVMTTYANYNQTSGSARLIQYVRVGAGAGTGNRLYSVNANNNIFAPSSVLFDFTDALDPSLIPALQGQLAATMTLDASTTSTIMAAGNNRSQNGFTGFVSFDLVAPITGKTNLLTISFTNAMLSTRQGSTSGSFFGSDPLTTFTASSEFVTFLPGTLYDFSFALTAFNPSFSGANGTYGRAFRATGGGEFSSDPPPVVPEPATWAMLIVGFGMVGASLRRRAAMARVAA